LFHDKFDIAQLLAKVARQLIDDTGDFVSDFLVIHRS
jgi:hypothetical protein